MRLPLYFTPQNIFRFILTDSCNKFKYFMVLSEFVKLFFNFQVFFYLKISKQYKKGDTVICDTMISPAETNGEMR